MNRPWFAFLPLPRSSSYEDEQRVGLLHFMPMSIFKGGLANFDLNYLNGCISSRCENGRKQSSCSDAYRSSRNRYFIAELRVGYMSFTALLTMVEAPQ